MVREIFTEIDRRFNIRQGLQSRLRNRRFWRDSGLLMLANVIVMALGLVRTPAMTWLLPKSEVGMLGVAASWLPFLQLLSLSGLDQASYHYVAKGQPWAFATNLIYRLRWSLLSAAGFLIGAAFWFLRGEWSLAWLFVVAGLSYPLTTGLSAAAGMLGAQERFTSLFWYRIWESLTDFTGFLPLALSAWWISQAVTFYAANQLATAAMMVGVSAWLLHRLRREGARPMPVQEKREMVRYGMHLTAMNGIGVIQTRSDALLVGTFLPLTTMADYTIALLIYEQFKRLWSVYLSVRYPPFVRLPGGLRRRKMLREGWVIWLGFGVAGAAAILLASWLIPVVLPASYRSSLPYIAWLVATFVVSVPGFFAETYFRTEQDEKRQYFLRTLAAATGVGLPVLLISPLGVQGVLLGRFLASLVLSASGILHFYRENRHAD